MTQPKRSRLAWAGASVAALAALAAETQRRQIKRIAADPESQALRDPAEGRPQEVVSSDGTELHVESFGPEQGQPIVLAHGWTEQISYWTYEIRALSERGFRVLAYDLRGHGASQPAAGGDYSLARFGEDLETVLEACVPEGQLAVVAGHSLGAMSIVAWAEHHEVGRRVGAAALLNTGVGELIAEQLLMPVPGVARALNQAIAVRGFLGSRAPLPRASTPISHALARYVAFGKDATPAQVAFYERMLISCPPDVRASVGIAISEMDLAHALPQLTVPTLVVAGADDRLTPRSHAERIAAQLPQLHRLVILPRTGHMAPLERPREISEMLATLAERVSLGHSVTV